VVQSKRYVEFLEPARVLCFCSLTRRCAQKNLIRLEGTLAGFDRATVDPYGLFRFLSVFLSVLFHNVLDCSVYRMWAQSTIPLASTVVSYYPLQFTMVLVGNGHFPLDIPLDISPNIGHFPPPLTECQYGLQDTRNIPTGTLKPY
jgi:hypothetical protein